MKHILLAFLIIAGSSLAHAMGQEKGGGIVLKNKGHYYLYDFAESGLEDSAALAPDFGDPEDLEPQLLRSMNGDRELVAAVLNKYYQIQSKNKHIAFQLKKEFFTKFAFRFLNADLVKTKDLGATPIAPAKASEALQVAVRDDLKRIVWIDRGVWQQLAFAHKVGLIFHEAFYAIMDVKDSSYPRSLNAAVFAPSFGDENPNSFLETLNTFMRIQTGYYTGPVVSNAEFSDLGLGNNFVALKNKIKSSLRYLEAFHITLGMRFEQKTRSLRGSQCRSSEYLVISRGNQDLFRENDGKYESRIWGKESTFGVARIFVTEPRLLSDLIREPVSWYCGKSGGVFSSNSVTVASGWWSSINDSEKNEALRNLLFLKDTQQKLLEYGFEQIQPRDSELEQLINVIDRLEFENAY